MVYPREYGDWGSAIREAEAARLLRDRSLTISGSASTLSSSSSQKGKGKKRRDTDDESDSDWSVLGRKKAALRQGQSPPSIPSPAYADKNHASLAHPFINDSHFDCDASSSRMGLNSETVREASPYIDITGSDSDDDGPKRYMTGVDSDHYLTMQMSRWSHTTPEPRPQADIEQGPIASTSEVQINVLRDCSDSPLPLRPPKRLKRKSSDDDLCKRSPKRPANNNALFPVPSTPAIYRSNPWGKSQFKLRKGFILF